MRAGQFPRVGRLHKGYSRKQVDAFVNDVELALSGALPPPTAAEIRQAGFELTRGGYETEAVDAALDVLEERVLVVQEQTAGRRGQPDPAAEAAVLRRELDRPQMQRFPRVRGMRRGYDRGDVDAFVDRLLVGLAGTGPEVRVEDVRSAAFRSRRGGYREDEVDETLDRVVELLMAQRRSPQP